jgi:hypothetical protein
MSLSKTQMKVLIVGGSRNIGYLSGILLLGKYYMKMLLLAADLISKSKGTL